ncbi:NUDIX hydrolase domain [Trinorchestia longiramus]|nr:NUDIX hydrolase domain [Trinorchestia longiramus]
MGLVDWWQSRKQEPVENTNTSPTPQSASPNTEEEADLNEDNSSELSQSQDVPAEETDENHQEVANEPEQKKGFFDRFSIFKKDSPAEAEITPMESEDVFSPPRKKDKQVEKDWKGKTLKLDNSPSVDEMVRIKVWLRRNRNEPFRPAKFCDCLVDYFASADQRNIYSAPLQFTSKAGSTLNIPQAGGSLKDPSDKSSLHSSSEYLSWSGINTPFGCCSVNRSSLHSSIKQSANHSCCLHSPKTEAISVTVECTLQDNRVLMQPAPADVNVDRHVGKKRQLGRLSNSAHSFIAVLEHPPFCCPHRISAKDYTDLPAEDKQRGVDVGVAVLLESSDQRLLITRRAPHMRTFPGVWVPPGGHIEDGETLIDAGIREIFEETGLRLFKGKKPDSIFLKIPNPEDESNSKEDSEETFDEEEVNRYSLLGLWESCYPPVLYAGTPKKQHLVYYMHVVLSQSADVIEKQLKLERGAVSACVWLDRPHVEVVAYSSRPLPDTPIPITVVDHSSETSVPGTLDPKVLRKKMPEPTRDIERFTTGTRFALKLWLGPREDQEEAEPRAASSEP